MHVHVSSYLAVFELTWHPSEEHACAEKSKSSSPLHVVIWSSPNINSAESHMTTESLSHTSSLLPSSSICTPLIALYQKPLAVQ